ncbi:hypothetical protein HanRHA438_Chr17g0812721 [Helianthus annuus]|nr:hypothetical protein HanRHA438_Chr17g0812721 [Helianthus annuus]
MSVPHSKDHNTPQQRSPTLYNREFVLDRSKKPYSLQQGICSRSFTILLSCLLSPLATIAAISQRWGLWILLVRPKRMLRYRKVCLFFSCLHLIISFDFDFVVNM